jgi:hypothetical protein
MKESEVANGKAPVSSTVPSPEYGRSFCSLYNVIPQVALGYPAS